MNATLAQNSTTFQSLACDIQFLTGYIEGRRSKTVPLPEKRERKRKKSHKKKRKGKTLDMSVCESDTSLCPELTSASILAKTLVELSQVLFKLFDNESGKID